MALLIRSADPEADARLLGDIVGRPVRGTTVELPGAEVRFSEGAPPGVYGIVVRGQTPSLETAELAGLTVVVEP